MLLLLRDGETRSNGRRYQHQGLDIEAAPNTPIFSVADGRIAFIIDPPRSDYGRQLLYYCSD